MPMSAKKWSLTVWVLLVQCQCLMPITNIFKAISLKLSPARRPTLFLALCVATLGPTFRGQKQGKKNEDDKM
jgi:hypothetical protein